MEHNFFKIILASHTFGFARHKSLPFTKTKELFFVIAQ
jgi:hypothetical protein